MLTVRQLEKMSQIRLDNSDKTGFSDICKIKLDTSLSPEQKMMDYLEQVKNPYHFLCCGSAVHIIFDPEGCELESKLKNFFINLKYNDKGCEKSWPG